MARGSTVGGLLIWHTHSHRSLWQTEKSRPRGGARKRDDKLTALLSVCWSCWRNAAAKMIYLLIRKWCAPRAEDVLLMILTLNEYFKRVRLEKCAVNSSGPLAPDSVSPLSVSSPFPPCGRPPCVAVGPAIFCCSFKRCSRSSLSALQ